jgi:hypothetical protein
MNMVFWAVIPYSLKMSANVSLKHNMQNSSNPHGIKARKLRLFMAVSFFYLPPNP